MNISPVISPKHNFTSRMDYKARGLESSKLLNNQKYDYSFFDNQKENIDKIIIPIQKNISPEAKAKAKDYALFLFKKADDWKFIADTRYEIYSSVVKNGWQDANYENGNPKFRCYPSEDRQSGWIFSYDMQGKIVDRFHLEKSNDATNATISSIYGGNKENIFMYRNHELTQLNLSKSGRTCGLKVLYGILGQDRISISKNVIEFPQDQYMPHCYDFNCQFKDGALIKATQRTNIDNVHLDEYSMPTYQSFIY